MEVETSSLTWCIATSCRLTYPAWHDTSLPHHHHLIMVCHLMEVTHPFLLMWPATLNEGVTFVWPATHLMMGECNWFAFIIASSSLDACFSLLLPWGFGRWEGVEFHPRKDKRVWRTQEEDTTSWVCESLLVFSLFSLFKFYPRALESASTLGALFSILEC